MRLRYLFDGPLGQTPCLLVFDDFEKATSTNATAATCCPANGAILPALLHAIRDTNSPSRVMITSRYRFPAPAGTTMRVEALETLTEVEQTKKIANLPNLRPDSPDAHRTVKERADPGRGRQPPPARLARPDRRRHQPRRRRR